MIPAVIILLFVLGNSANGANSQAQTPAPVLREIVFSLQYDKFSEALMYFIDGSSEFSKDPEDKYSGRVTIDVTAVGDDGSIRLNSQATFDDASGRPPL